MIKQICNEIMQGKEPIRNVTLSKVPYEIKVFLPDPTTGINMPSIVAIPTAPRISRQMILETNTLESEDLEKNIERAAEILAKIAAVTNNAPAPIVIPLIPSKEDMPYFQQLSADCFTMSEHSQYYRIDKQVLYVLQNAKDYFFKRTGIIAQEKVFINGYSSSGVFAQRFSLLHPEITDTVCIGGASGSIPLPTEKFDYPLGIKNYQEITGEAFDKNSYLDITFRYYVGGLESETKSKTILDEDGLPAPMHDMSYNERSISKDLGQQQRDLFGKDLLQRASTTVNILKAAGINIEHIVYPGKTHKNDRGMGVTGVADKFINDTYKTSIKRNNSMVTREETKVAN